eukprot:CAMPEP_0117547076 /NCGR_PEP_ID=MMETSP0784-20121206/46934_1 /TAXON_ID=39447 /ORGANISM="" /LENGTH=410 /DNA_ID=CAMNT_0005343963 /DNA_START=133 /DNA_END=1365 /DNA_ORIENTATION=+
MVVHTSSKWLSPWCELAARNACASSCYPELKGLHCDGSGPSVEMWRCDSLEPLSEQNCTCSLNKKLYNFLEACGDSAPGSVRVFAPGEHNITCYRIPAIVRTERGTLLAFAEARHGGCGDGLVHEIAMRRSTDHGKTWSDSTPFIVGGQSYFVGNPYPISMDSGRVAVVFVNHTGGHGPDLGSGNAVVFSDDDGVTWSKPMIISGGFGKAQGSLPGPGAGVELDTGRLLVVSHHNAYVNDYITYSDDAGRTWNTLNRTFPKMDEGTFAGLGGGEVLLNMRHRDEPALGRGVARSFDGGLTWTNVTFDKTLIGPACQGSLAAIGGSVYFSNPASTTDRSSLTVRRSDDGGRTWTAKLEIQKGVSAGYSSLVQGSVGDAMHGGILYESTTPGSLDFKVFPLDLHEDFSTFFV